MNEEFYKILKRKNNELNLGLEEYDFQSIYDIFYSILADEDLTYFDESYKDEKIIMRAIREYLRIEKKVLQDTLKTDKKIDKGLIPEIHEFLARSDEVYEIDQSYDDNSHVI